MISITSISILVFLLLSFSTTTTHAFHHVIAATGALEVQLITAKLAIKAGDTCALIGSSEKSHVRTCRALMYGSANAKKFDYTTDLSTVSATNPLSFVTEGVSIAASLSGADYLHLICEDKALGDSMVGSLLSSAPNVKHVSLLSKMGGGFRGMEQVAQDICNERNVPFTVVRAGVLKGGGPGDPKDKDSEEKEEEWGLSKFFYDTNFDLPSAMNTMAFDRFTLGAKVTPGDPFKKPGKFFAGFSSNISFEPSNTDTGRIAAAQALLASVQRENGIDISLSTEKGKVPPSLEEWKLLLDTAV